MVIQSNMSSKAIVEVWGDTAEVFNKYKIPISEQTLVELVQKNFLPELLTELNNTVGSSNLSCVDGG